MGNNFWFIVSLAFAWPMLTVLVYWLLAGRNNIAPPSEEQKARDREGFAAYIESLPDRRRKLPELDVTPDMPRTIHLWAAWLAVPNCTTEALAGALGLSHREPANWETGLANALPGGLRVFVTPPVDGWTFAVMRPPFNYYALEYEPAISARRLVESLSRDYGAAFYFANDDEFRLHNWVRADSGAVTRAYGFISVYGPRMAFECGEPTPVEQQIGIEAMFTRSDAHDGPMREGMRYPTTTDLIAVARSWTLDPTSLASGDREKGVGILGNLDGKYLWWE